LKLFCMLTGALMIVRFHSILWRLDDVSLHFCERVLISNTDVRVQYRLVCCMLCCVEIELYLTDRQLFQCTLYYFNIYYFNHNILNMQCQNSQSTTLWPIVYITLSKYYFSPKMAGIDKAETCSCK